MNTINIGTDINLQDLLQSRMLIQANSGGGKSALARAIIEQSNGLVPFIVLDKEGEYYTLKEKYGDILVIGGQYADIPISLKSAKLLPKEIIGNRLSVIIDLSDLSTTDKRLYVKYFLEAMFHLSKEYWVGYLIFVEEAHFFCGEQDKFESGAAVKELMSAGRKRGYCGILITQRISKLHKDAAAECNNKFIGRTFLDIDMDRSAKELGFSSAKDRLQLRDLAPGHFFAFGTSIEPHHVHEVTINEPITKLPKAGSDLFIKAKKPTDKILSVLTKLNDLPQEAEKELKTLQQLQQENTRLKKELTAKPKNEVKQDDTLSISLNEKFKEYKTSTDGLIQELKNTIKGQDVIVKILLKEQNGIRKILNASEIKIPELPKERAMPIPVPVHKAFTEHNQRFADKVYKKVNENAGNGSLGKCSFAILQFLASYPERSWSKAQVGIATGYSPNSGGFNNSKSELNSKGLIVSNNGKLQLNADADLSQWNFEEQQYSIDTFKNKLGKCESEIYQVLLDNPNDTFSKEELASKTESQYSYNSGGFNNSISRLSTLELIERRNGRIQLNPELLEI